MAHFPSIPLVGTGREADGTNNKLSEKVAILVTT